MRACRLPPAGPEEDAHKPAEEAGDGPGPAVQVTPASGIARFLLSDASSIQPGVTGVCEMGLMPDSELPVHPCGRQGGSRAAPSTPALAGLLCSFRRWRPPPPESSAVVVGEGTCRHLVHQPPLPGTSAPSGGAPPAA